MKAPHQHDYQKIRLVPVIADRLPPANDIPGYSIGLHLPLLGLTIKPMAFLVRVCECKKDQPFDYGERRAMSERYKVLTRDKEVVTT